MFYIVLFCTSIDSSGNPLENYDTKNTSDESNLARKETQRRPGRSRYLDFYPAITRPDSGAQTRREFLSLYLHDRPRTDLERQHNKETKILAENIAAKRQLEIQAGSYGFLARSTKSRDFLEYFRADLANHDSSYSTRQSWEHTLLYSADFTNNACLVVSQVNHKLVEDFKNYLLTCPSRAAGNRRLSQNTAALYFQKFCSLLRKASKDKLLPENLAETAVKIKSKDSVREYLTIEELQRIAATDYPIPAIVRAAALFSALTGLRFSDIQALTWDNLRQGDSGHFLAFEIRKTGEHLTLPISDEAAELAGTRGDSKARIFPGLEYNSMTSIHIGRWAIAAGIGKPITFHSFRHTFAAAQLTLGTDLYTVSKLLGHKSIEQHTQVYARIIDEKQREAAGKIKLK